MIADLTAAGVATLDAATEQAAETVAHMLRWGGTDNLDVPIRASGTLDLQLREPETPGRQWSFGSVGKALEVYPALAGILTGSAAVVSVLTGPGAIAASIALAACAGWWYVRGDSEQQRRTHLREWVEAATVDAKSRFATELERRVAEVERYVEAALPELLAARQAHPAAGRAHRAAPLRRGSTAACGGPPRRTRTPHPGRSRARRGMPDLSGGTR
jgi:hypothetical protein